MTNMVKHVMVKYVMVKHGQTYHGQTCHGQVWSSMVTHHLVYACLAILPAHPAQRSARLPVCLPVPVLQHRQCNTAVYHKVADSSRHPWVANWTSPMAGIESLAGELHTRGETVWMASPPIIDASRNELPEASCQMHAG